MNRGLLFVLPLLAASVAAGAEQVVWQIGVPDRNWKEFAIAGDYPAYRDAFGRKPLVFEVGKSQPEKDWPFIHPGPADAWAGHGVHPRTIRFQLPEAPQGVFTFRLEMVDVQGMIPPTLAVRIGGRGGQFRLQPGGGDASLTNPQAGKPQEIELVLPSDMFQQGANEIVLACTEGSWIQYDAISLLNDRQGSLPAPEIRSLTIRPTPFYVRHEGKPRRAVDVTVDVTGPVGDLSLRAEAGGESIEVPVRQLPQFGSITHELAVPDSLEPLEVKVTASLAGREKSASASVPPQRKWQIFVAPSAHTDIGYTHLQPECAERHNQNIDSAIELLKTYPDFRWNLEVAWQAENYVTARRGAQLADFLRLAREGRLGVQALYCNILTGLCSHEQACRLTLFGSRLCSREGIPYESAMISDVPTQEATLPMLLAESGIRYFSSGINNTRAKTFRRLYDRCPAWWEGPDGSRVLMMWVPGYAHASGWGLDQSVDRARERILDAIRSYEKRPDYPFDAIFLHGAVSDNCLLSPKLAEVAKEWNDRYESPKIILSKNAEFFEHIEKNFADKLPVIRGSGGTYWEDGAGSSAQETALCRGAHEAVANAEKFFSLARRIRPDVAYPQKDIEATWRNCLLYDEHTWGAHCSINDPESPFTKSQWEIKARFATDASRDAKRLWDDAARAVAGLVRTDAQALVVVNPSSWPRTEILRVNLPDGTTIAEPDTSLCDSVHGTYVLVRDVPACGYRVLKLAAGSRPKAEPIEADAIESRLYRACFDATGAVTSLQDKQTGRELVDAKAPYRLNQYLYAASGKGPQVVEQVPAGPLEISSPQQATIRRFRLGDLGEMAVVETSAAMTPKLVQTVTVWNDVKRVDVANHLSKTSTYDKEAVYFAFPFAARKPVFRYEVPAGVVCANTDMLPGACLEWFTVQHFVEVADGDSAVAWATPDAPLVCFQDVNRGKWPTELAWDNGHLFAYVMNNYWFTNYKAGQGGDFTFRFSITSGPKGDTAAPARFGWDVSNPLVGVVADANPAGPLAGPSASLVSIDEPNVLLVGARKPDRGDGLLVRLWEVNGRPTTAHLRLGPIEIQKATACNLAEEVRGPLEIRDGAIAVPIKARGLATVHVE